MKCATGLADFRAPPTTCRWLSWVSAGILTPRNHTTWIQVSSGWINLNARAVTKAMLLLKVMEKMELIETELMIILWNWFMQKLRENLLNQLLQVTSPVINPTIRGYHFIYFHFFFAVLQDMESKEGSKDVTTPQSKTSDIKKVVNKVQSCPENIGWKTHCHQTDTGCYCLVENRVS